MTSFADIRERVSSPTAIATCRRRSSNLAGRKLAFRGCLATLAAILTFHPNAGAARSNEDTSDSLSTAGPGIEVAGWNAEVLDAIRADSTSPALATRNLAIVHLAAYDAYVTAGGNTEAAMHHLLSEEIAPERGLLPEVAAAAAFEEAAAILFPTRAARIREVIGVSKQSAKLRSHGRERLRQSEELGVTMAREHLRQRQDDGAARTITFIPSKEPGQWRRTPPRLRPPEMPHWGTVRPFFLQSASQFRAPAPPALGSERYVQEVEEIFRLGGTHSQERTEAETNDALFWACFSYTATPPGHWNIIVRHLLEEREVTFEAALKTYALLNVVQADSAIACWDTKYHYRVWRPIDAVREAGLADGPWASLLEAPPHPEYVSGHSTFAGAGAEVLQRVFGEDAIAFHATSDSMPGVERHYSAFSQCAKEMGRSRIFGGIHFSVSDENGRKLGAEVARFICERFRDDLGWRFPLLAAEPRS